MPGASGGRLKGVRAPAKPSRSPAPDEEESPTIVDHVPSFRPRSSVPPRPREELFDADETGTTSARVWMTLTAFARLRQVKAVRKTHPRAIPLGRALRVRVRWLDGAWPLGTLLAGIAGALVLATGVLVFLALRWLGPAPLVVTESAAPAPRGADSSLLQGPELTVAQRASLGDEAAAAALTQRDPLLRTAEEVLAPAEGERVLRRQSLVELGDTIVTRPQTLREARVAARLREDLDDPGLATEVLRLLARVKDHLGPDLLYQIREDRARGTVLRDLAAALLATNEVRTYASPALLVALDIEGVTDCIRAASLVDIALAHADERTLRPLMRLTQPTGCEPSGTADCFLCLRNGTELRQALEVAGQRPPPDLPSLRRPQPLFFEAPTADGDADPKRLLGDEAAASGSERGRRRLPSAASREPGF